MKYPSKLNIQAIFLLLLAFGLGAIGCKGPDPDPLDYDRANLLENVAKRYILPAYADMGDKLDALESAANAFLQGGDAADLDALQTALRESRMVWVKVSPFEFGPAAAVSLRGNVNTFPVDKAQIEGNVAAGTWDLDQAANADARGFPALDYLLHHSDDATLMAEFDVSQPANARGRLLQDLIADLKNLLQAEVYDGWQASGDNYQASFVASLGTDAGSSSAFLVNQLNFDLEQLKNARVGIPLGKKSLDVPLPEKVESRYGGYSAALALAQLQGIRAVYEGTDYAGGSNGYGLREALDALEAQYNGELLGPVISAQFEAAIASLSTVPDPLYDAVQSNRPPVETAYADIQRLVTLLKTDLPSAMGILITYTDNDGD